MSWLKYLKQWTPRSGRYIAEDGDSVNVADVSRRADRANFLATVDDGNIYQAHYRARSLGPDETLLFAQPIAGPLEIRGIAFSGVISGGPIEYKQYTGGTIGTTLETIDGINGDRRDEAASDNPILLIDSYTPRRLIEESFGLTSTSGSGRASAGLTSAGIGGIYDTDHAPVFELTNTGNGDTELAMFWVWKERQV